MRNQTNFEKIYATGENPVYVVQESDAPRPDTVHLLLGENLIAVTLALGKFCKEHKKLGSQRLHIKSDAISGIKIAGLTIEDPHDAVGRLDPQRKITETIKDASENFSLTAAKNNSGGEDGMNFLDLTSICAAKTTLIINRNILKHHGIAPELLKGRANPYFEEMVLIPLRFRELVESVMAAVNGNKYLLID